MMPRNNEEHAGGAGSAVSPKRQAIAAHEQRTASAPWRPSDLQRLWDAAPDPHTKLTAEQRAHLQALFPDRSWSAIRKQWQFVKYSIPDAVLRPTLYSDDSTAPASQACPVEARDVMPVQTVTQGLLRT